MTNASVNQSSPFEQALNRAASTYEGHVDHGRLVKAVELAKNGSVELDDDGTAIVIGSKRTYYVNGTCECDDAQYAGKYCKHSMAVELTKMAHNYLTAHDRAAQPSHTPPEQPAPWHGAQAPSSCTMKWEDGGVELMLTLRDSSDQQLFARLGTVLPRIKDTVAAERQQRRQAAQQRKDDEAAAAQAATTEGTAATRRKAPDPDDDNAAHFCVKHDVPFTRKSKGNHAWYSHWDDESEAWCREER